MSYDRNSFLAGLAVGRTLWRPHRDYASGPEPPGWDLIENSTGILGRNQYYQPSVNVLVEKGSSSGNYWHFSPLATEGYTVSDGGTGNTAGMFNVFVPRQYRTLYVDVVVDRATVSGYDLSGIHIRDAYGITGPYASSFAGNALKDVYFANYSMTVEQINGQAGVVINSTSQYVLSRQVVEIDISDINVDMWIGLHRCDNNTEIYSIIARG